MTDQELSKIRKTFVMYAAYYRHQQLPDEVIQMYASDLSDLNYDDVVKAFDKYRKDARNKTCPLPAHIREVVLELNRSKTKPLLLMSATKDVWPNGFLKTLFEKAGAKDLNEVVRIESRKLESGT